MRLLMTTDTVGGVWTFTSTLTQELLKRGHTVHLVSFGRAPSSEQLAWTETQSTTPSISLLADRTRCPLDRSATASSSRGAERPRYAPVVVAEELQAAPPAFTYTRSTLPLEWMQNNDGTFEAGERLLLRAADSFHPDLILSNQFCFGRLHTGVPRVVVAHSDVLSWARACRPSALAASPWLNRYSAIVQAGLLNASALVTPSACMGKALKSSFLLPDNPFVIPNGVRIEPAPAPQRKLQAITAGRLWDEAKGLDTLTDLSAPMPLLVAGDHSLVPGAAPAGWPAHLTNLGPLSQPELHRNFRESALYLCTSRYEPFGLAPLEAALCGCALVLRDLPSLREVWGDSAVYFTDNASLEATLQALADKPHLLAEGQRRALVRARTYTPERMADSYLHLFQTVLQQQAGQHVA